MSACWEHFPHGADVGVRGLGSTKAESFEQAALALTAVITDPTEVEPREAVAIQCEAPDDELLLADWLNSLIYEMSTRRMHWRGDRALRREARPRSHRRGAARALRAAPRRL